MLVVCRKGRDILVDMCTVTKNSFVGGYFCANGDDDDDDDDDDDAGTGY